ncbi:hypothetical protein FRC08_005448 [Ceratobasidium sp. 394]|nr:hypothetical protein FRC08_005448 [Ceratobasidium sp. 394]
MGDTSGDERHLAKEAIPVVQNKEMTDADSVDQKSTASLLAMPAELHLQIVSSITSPNDLLALARTCKALRARVLAKSSIKIWIRAEQLVPGLPPRPSFLSSPQYAALAFMNECSLCGGDTNINLVAGLRVRLCEPCYESELIDIWSIEGSTEQTLTKHLPQIVKVPIVPSKYSPTGPKDDRRDSPHCLRRDLEALYSTRERFLRSGDCVGLEHWEWKRRTQMEIYVEFAQNLEQFMNPPQLPLPKQTVPEGISDNHDNNAEEHDGQNGDEDVDDEDMVAEDEDWFNNMGPNGHKPRRFLLQLLQSIYPLTHPFRKVLEALGLKLNLHPDAYDFLVTRPDPLKTYPFPTVPTVLSWPCFSRIDELELELEIRNLVCNNLDDIFEHIRDWQEAGERELVEWWVSSGESADRPVNPVLTVRGSTSTTEDLSPNLRFLLRADTVFSTTEPFGLQTAQDPDLHHPCASLSPLDLDSPCFSVFWPDSVFEEGPQGMNRRRMY